LNEFVESKNRQRYEEDQKRLWKLIVLGPQAGVAQVPIIFNSTHPNPSMQNKAFLPCCVLKKRIGNPALEHFSYLLVVFFDGTDSTRLDKNPALIGDATNTALDVARAAARGPSGLASGDGKGHRTGSAGATRPAPRPAGDKPKAARRSATKPRKRS